MPDPKANDATLAGIDTTGIGIRDDVHIWIYTNYTTTVKRTILMTMAKAMQDVMVTPPRTAEEAKSLDYSYKEAAMMFKFVRGLTQSEVEQMDEFLFYAGGQHAGTPECVSEVQPAVASGQGRALNRDIPLGGASGAQYDIGLHYETARICLVLCY